MLNQQCQNVCFYLILFDLRQQAGILTAEYYLFPFMLSVLKVQHSVLFAVFIYSIWTLIFSQKGPLSGLHAHLLSNFRKFLLSLVLLVMVRSSPPFNLWDLIQPSP